MPLRTALPLIIGVLLLGIVAGARWKPAPAPPPPPPRELDYHPPRGLVCHRAIEPIAIDGRLDDAAWRDIPWSEDFVDIEGEQRPRPRFRTRVKLAWDDSALYIAAELEEPHVRATFTRHDSYIFHEDSDFEVFLDPDGDGVLYAELEMNALNTTWDLLLVRPYSAGGPALDAWEIAGLKTAVHVDGTLNNAADTDHGWTIEMAWPWTALKALARRPVPPRPGDQWRINFSRVELDFEVVQGQYRRLRTPEHNWVWSPQGVIDMHRPEHWGYLQFSSGKPGSESVRADPTGPARALLSRVYHEQNSFRSRTGRFATTLAELEMAGLTHETLAGPPHMEVTSSWFETSAGLRDGTRIRIQADGRVDVEPPRQAATNSGR